MRGHRLNHLREPGRKTAKVPGRRAGCLFLVLAAGSFGIVHAQSPEARRIFDLTNQDRQDHGLPALRWSTSLAVAAQAHADRMRQEPALSHQYPGEPGLMTRAAQAGAHFEAVAENIATGPDADAINREWMHSPSHRENILDPRMNSLGVAVAEVGGTLYAVEDFDEALPMLNSSQVEERVRDLLRAGGINDFAAKEPAEEACRLDRGMPQVAAIRSMVRFQTPDLTQLPAQVVQQIRTGGFSKAAVGACVPTESSTGFTLYRVAILFY